jgi:hypothetical protein
MTSSALTDAAARFREREEKMQEGGTQYKKTEFVKTTNGDNLITLAADSEGQDFVMQKAWMHRGPAVQGLYTAMDWDWLCNDPDGSLVLDRAIGQGKISDVDVETAVSQRDPVRSTLLAMAEISGAKKSLFPSPREQYVTCAGHKGSGVVGLYTAPRTVMSGVVALSDDFPVFSGGFVVNVQRSGHDLSTEYQVTPKPSEEAMEVDTDDISVIAFAARRVRSMADTGKIALDLCRSALAIKLIDTTDLTKEDVGELVVRLHEVYGVEVV